MGGENERRDKEVKLELYASRGLQEYWIVDWQKATLILIEILFADDELTSPLFSDLVCLVGSLFV
ncbi:Uma2 family endonuclease [Dolichospermum sp. UHCC 0259]|uniref:Uma2 family endonuclease n=1 Tax=Dolichospermum sp. UHCC 0259 TaxID=2590010 RepID=UPI00352BBB9D